MNCNNLTVSLIIVGVIRIMVGYDRDNPLDPRSTRFLGSQDSPLMNPRQTDPLDLDTPHTIRFVLPDMTAVFDVTVRRFMVIGRKSGPYDQQVDIDLSPFDGKLKGVSRYHAILTVNRGRVYLKDTSSSNGTFINGAALQPLESYLLRNGDEVSFGALKLKAQFVRTNPPE